MERSRLKRESNDSVHSPLLRPVKKDLLRAESGELKHSHSTLYPNLQASSGDDRGL